MKSSALFERVILLGETIVADGHYSSSSEATFATDPNQSWLEAYASSENWDTKDVSGLQTAGFGTESAWERRSFGAAQSSSAELDLQRLCDVDEVGKWLSVSST
jgi:hypothetical protein